MPRYHQLYDVQSLYIGPSPSWTGHFISGSGIVNNAFDDLGSNNNLLKSLSRVQSASYSFNIEYTDIKQLGLRGQVYQPIVNSPQVTLSFDYINCSVLNELRLGLNVNYANDDDDTIYYSDNFGQSLISGLVDRQLIQPTGTPRWPLSTRDRRNLFIIVGDPNIDVNKSTYSVADPSCKSYDVYCFGDAYLTSYNTRGSVGAFPTSSVSFVCDNLELVGSGSGVQIPALNTQDRTYKNANRFVIPTNDQTGIISTFLPGDINLSFYSIPKFTGILVMYGTGYIVGTQDSNIVDLTVDFSDIKVQSYEIGLDLPRNPLRALGYQLPVDKPIVFPIFATLSTSFIVGDNQTGRLVDLVDKNNDYNVIITAKNPSFSTKAGVVGLQYDFKRAKLNSLSIDSNIGSSKIVNLGFTTELNPDNLTKGLFISGRLNIPGGEEASDYLLNKNDSSKILISNVNSDAILIWTFTTGEQFIMF